MFLKFDVDGHRILELLKVIGRIIDARRKRYANRRAALEAEVEARERYPKRYDDPSRALFELALEEELLARQTEILAWMRASVSPEGSYALSLEEIDRLIRGALFAPSSHG